MDTTHYLHKFERIVDKFDKNLFTQKQLELKVGVWLNSVALKIQKPSWVNTPQKPLSFQESIFFSVWINADTICENRLYYNIHALKLRELNAYIVKSRDFATAFRSRFDAFKEAWPNVSVNFGPLTLMEGWTTIEGDHYENIITELVYKFLDITFIIDELLEERKAKQTR
jgi:hypothetical protein